MKWFYFTSKRLLKLIFWRQPYNLICSNEKLDCLGLADIGLRIYSSRAEIILYIEIRSVKLCSKFKSSKTYYTQPACINVKYT
jgi:hypothetical protein